MQIFLFIRIAMSKFRKAARDNNILLLLDSGKKDLRKKDDEGLNPGHWAAKQGCLDALKVVLGRGGDVNCVDGTGRNALHWAAEKNRQDCAHFLLKCGTANPWALTDRARTALDLAGNLGHMEMVCEKFLILASSI